MKVITLNEIHFGDVLEVTGYWDKEIKASKKVQVIEREIFEAPFDGLIGKLTLMDEDKKLYTFECQESQVYTLLERKAPEEEKLDVLSEEVIETDEMEIRQYYLYKPKRFFSSKVNSLAETFIITDFAFTPSVVNTPEEADEKMVIVVHGYYGVDNPFSILGLYFTRKQFEEYFELYMTEEEMESEYEITSTKEFVN